MPALAANDSIPSGLDPDGDIIDQIAAGDQQAFARLVDRHVGSLSALAAQMLGDQYAAEDIVQTVFMKTWQMLPAWRKGEAKLITWMRRVATNMCLDYLRKHKPVYTDQVPDIASETSSQEFRLGEQEDRQHILSLMDKLPERQRAALTLSYYQELSLKEGSEIMELGVSAYESLLRRARMSLKHHLQSSEQFKDKNWSLS